MYRSLSLQMVLDEAFGNTLEPLRYTKEELRGDEN
jgi:hypothetical protein